MPLCWRLQNRGEEMSTRVSAERVVQTAGRIGKIWEVLYNGSSAISDGYGVTEPLYGVRNMYLSNLAGIPLDLDAFTGGVTKPTGTAVVVPGGFRISGRWTFSISSRPARICGSSARAAARAYTGVSAGHRTLR
jgi:hypothetical protein